MRTPSFQLVWMACAAGCGRTYLVRPRHKNSDPPETYRDPNIVAVSLLVDGGPNLRHLTTEVQALTDMKVLDIFGALGFRV